jgi:hypothetical protein
VIIPRDDSDELRAARGIVIWVVVCLTAWIIIGLAIWAIFG